MLQRSLSETLKKEGRIYAQGVTRSHDFNYIPNNVADAFYRRGRLVELVFAQERYVISMYTHDAQNDREAYEEALARSRRFRDDLGNVLRSQVLPDTESSRAYLKVDGAAFSTRTEYGTEWRNAA
jgi:hypothetical protein